ncbi:hypothetical protein BFR06_25315 [Burkholderia pseudomallei]|uniref:hypothetical protein n=1 Tax=Burkholderia pseudomallei TaxID=28450 RepID=UPI0003F75091|nr:hypothetical protein [Burkholderia pseudomallei]AIP19917.1 hypothetical protein DP63_5707 [Burkholderia pseudomallei MSHR5855]AIP43128.1 hypothetical protein DP65_3612 [Burkholderia pseudomallei MSHR5848]APF95129.1 hypothetical protein BFR05_25295 [Burkholderia pseudomallei]APG01175.1 hypothetical protein BFR06_25315 [Burkholderia pseudomallei]KEO69671.1 hypothetical protein J103_10300 [Burkholderia pseudomallei MSHR5855]
MQELNPQEIAHVSGGHYDGGSLFDTLGNLIEIAGKGAETIGNTLTFGLLSPISSAAYGVGEVLTTAAVNLGNSLLNLFGIPAKHY